MGTRRRRCCSTHARSRSIQPPSRCSTIWGGWRSHRGTKPGSLWRKVTTQPHSHWCVLGKPLRCNSLKFGRGEMKGEEETDTC